MTGNSLRSRLAPRQPYPETNKVVRRTKLHAREFFRRAVFRLREASSAAAVLTVTRDIRPGAAMMIEQALRIFLRALSADCVIKPRLGKRHVCNGHEPTKIVASSPPGHSLAGRPDCFWRTWRCRSLAGFSVTSSWFGAPHYRDLSEKASRAAPRSTRRSRRHYNSLGDRDEARVEARGTAFPLPRVPPLHGSRSGSPISAPVDQISETVPYGRCYQ